MELLRKQSVFITMDYHYDGRIDWCDENMKDWSTQSSLLNV